MAELITHIRKQATSGRRPEGSPLACAVHAQYSSPLARDDHEVMTPDQGGARPHVTRRQGDGNTGLTGQVRKPRRRGFGQSRRCV